MLKREESHVEQIRELTTEYTGMITQLRGRIDELETKIEQMTRRRASVVDSELYDLKEKLAAVTDARLAGLVHISYFKNYILKNCKKQINLKEN
jgi:Mg2+ and Co2+ transporter CorA